VVLVPVPVPLMLSPTLVWATLNCTISPPLPPDQAKPAFLLGTSVGIEIGVDVEVVVTCLGSNLCREISELEIPYPFAAILIDSTASNRSIMRRSIMIST